MRLHDDLVKTSVRMWADRHVEGAIRVHVADSICYDQKEIILTTQNYSKTAISGLAIAKCSGTQEMMRMLEQYLRHDLLNLADQLEKVASQIRSGL